MLSAGLCLKAVNIFLSSSFIYVKLSHFNKVQMSTSEERAPPLGVVWEEERGKKIKIKSGATTVACDCFALDASIAHTAQMLSPVVI